MKLNFFHLCIVKLITKKKKSHPANCISGTAGKKKEDIPPTALAGLRIKKRYPANCISGTAKKQNSPSSVARHQRVQKQTRVKSLKTDPISK